MITNDFIQKYKTFWRVHVEQTTTTKLTMDTPALSACRQSDNEQECKDVHSLAS